MELKTILKAVSEVTNISEEDIISKSRLKEHVTARHLYCYFALKKTNKTLSVVGKFINRNHASIIHGSNKVKNELNNYPDVEENVIMVNSKLFKIDYKWLKYHTINNNINISHVL